MTLGIDGKSITHLLVGPCLGHGKTRTVYELTHNPSTVLKVERSGTFDNVTEWILWRRLRKTPEGRWLAPCRKISPDGRYLLQARCMPLRPGEIPDDIPAWLAGNIDDNLGMFGSRVVFVDYAHAELLR